jgi:predicted MPP superfamily phosphohydrolase
MRIFFIIVFLIYGLVHLYAFLRARSALSFKRSTGIFLALFMVIMTFAPYLVRISENAGLDSLAIFVSHTGYIWMGLLFLFFSTSVAIDIYRLALFLAGAVLRSDTTGLKPSAGFSFFVPLILSVALSSYGFYEARNIRTEKVVIRTSKLPRDTGKFKIVQISDVHLGLIVKEDRLKRIIRKVKEESPDMLVSTGDLVDGQVNSLEGLDELLQKINAPYGKFAITGNHEFYAGLDHALEFTELAGFRVLRGEGITANGLINIAGVDDNAGRRFGLYSEVSEKEVLSGLPRDKFTLLLKHRPDIDREAIGLFDLQLSGHTHKGQIFPFRLLSRFFYPHVSGLVGLDGGSSLYVSRGSGTWGPPIRFLSPPEVTVIEIISE